MLVLPHVQMTRIMPMQSWILLTRESYRPVDELHVYICDALCQIIDSQESYLCMEPPTSREEHSASLLI